VSFHFTGESDQPERERERGQHGKEFDLVHHENRIMENFGGKASRILEIHSLKF
jgi:hypothetical protein